MSINWSIKKNFVITDNLKKILRFYLLECPIEKDNRRYLYQADLKKWKSDRLTRRMMSTSKLNKQTWRVVRISEVERCLEELNALDRVNPEREIAVHARAYNFNNPTALIHMIRCALAHGGFSQRSRNEETYYVFENLHEGEIKGRAILYEKTLLAWMKIIKEGPISKD